jgi:hypothetical protein
MSKRWIIVAGLLAGLSMPAIAMPQNSVSMSAVEVDLWPEYDRPDMLVIYKITLAPEVRLPAALNLRIPAAAGRPNAVAEKQLDGRLTSVTYDQRQDEEWISLILTASRPELQIEYYDRRLERDGANRSFIYSWPADYPVGALSVQVQQPQDAFDLRMDPAAEHTSPAGEEFIYHILHLGARDAGEPADVSVEYVKESETLSVATMPQATPAQPGMTPATTLPSEGGSEIPPWWVFAVLAVVLVSAGGGLWWRLGRGGKPATVPAGAGARATASVAPKAGTRPAAPTTARRSGARQGGGPRVEPSKATDGAAFCTQCGAPAGSGDRFCHACGAQIPND